ncbi:MULTISPECIES: ATP-binding protein [unclassified Streptomyces]|uniref:ATP-binding protein n=1 Tax=unclassified Streptomyces TaxID=2593676 RepID=UPI002E2E73BD|nr:ATP-binding protein [Streptomyces sp. NBC_00223]
MTIIRPSAGPKSAVSGTALRFKVPATPAAVRPARRRVLAKLRSWGVEEHEDFSYDVLLVLSELLTNAIVHGSGPLAVGVELDIDRVIVEVFDGNSRGPVQGKAGTDDENGRGLSVVSAVSLSQGCEDWPPGKRCWSVLQIP